MHIFAFAVDRSRSFVSSCRVCLLLCVGILCWDVGMRRAELGLQVVHTSSSRCTGYIAMVALHFVVPLCVVLGPVCGFGALLELHLQVERA